MKSKKNTSNGDESVWNKLIKKGNKHRKKRGLKKDGVWNNTLIGSENPEFALVMFKLSLSFNDKVDAIRKAFNGIPETLDGKCIEATGLNLQTYNNYFQEYAVRSVLCKEDSSRHPLEYMDTIGASFNGEDGGSEIVSISKEHHEHYLKCFESVCNRTDECMHFMHWFIETLEVDEVK